VKSGVSNEGGTAVIPSFDEAIIAFEVDGFFYAQNHAKQHVQPARFVRIGICKSEVDRVWRSPKAF
jgi:hypothetical protein